MRPVQQPIYIPKKTPITHMRMGEGGTTESRQTLWEGGANLEKFSRIGAKYFSTESYFSMGNFYRGGRISFLKF